MYIRPFIVRTSVLVGAILLACASATAQNGQVVVECSEPGWNWVDVGIPLTSNQPTYWSALTGQPAGVSPFTILDPGVLPGRPAFDGTGDRVLRGFIVAWAVNDAGEEIRWNHLKGDVLLVNYDLGSAWEYNAYALQTLNLAVPNGERIGSPGQLFFNGIEYDNAFDLLLLDFYATGSQPFGINSLFSVDSALTLMPMRIDLRQETEGPVTTKASFTVWNQNETKFTGMDRCITCWDDTLFSQYGAPNYLVIDNLQTDKGKAQIDGLASQLCNLDYDPGDACTQTFGGPAPACDPRDILSEAAPMLGVVVKHLNFMPPSGPQDSAGMHLVGMGVESGSLLADIGGAPPPERPTPSGLSIQPVGTRSPAAISGQDAASPLALLGSTDRVSASEKGSLIIFPKIELRWDSTGNTLVQDTFIDLTNDYPDNVFVQMYFVNGDAPFTPSALDANTNGVPDDCEDRVNWSCNTPNGTRNDIASDCHVNPDGPFTSLAECELNCNRYTCAPEADRGGGSENHNCVADPNGEFGSLAECESNCFRTVYQCDPDAQQCEPTYQPISILDEEGYHATFEECVQHCSRYTCLHLARGDGQVTCQPDPCGEYATYADCISSCGIRTYACTVEVARDTVGDCVPDPSGSYLTLGDCQDECPSVRYTCESDPPRGLTGTCRPSPSGEFFDLEECLACCDTRYTCLAPVRAAGPDGSLCVPDSNGEYASLEECEAACGISRYTCTGGSRGDDLDPIGCVPSASGEYATLEDCVATCGQAFSCISPFRGSDRSSIGCEVDTNGIYSTLGSCLAECPSTHYECDSEHEACYPTNDLAGTYATLGECENGCVRTYSCVFDTNGGHCELDADGPYTYNDCETVDICNPSRPEDTAPSPVTLPAPVKIKQKK